MDPLDELPIGCQEVIEVLDAYALGAAEKGDAKALERHVADCIRCWEELNKAQRTAALLALSAPLAEAPAGLGERLMAAAERKRRGTIPLSIFGRLTSNSPLAIGATAMAGVTALLFVGFAQMHDLQNENSTLERQVTAAGTELAQQQQVLAVLSASDTEKLPMSEIASRQGPTGVYTWSAVEGIGLLALRDLATQPGGRVYQMWFTYEDLTLPAGSCSPLNGSCEFIVYFGFARQHPDGVGVSVEPAGGSLAPTERWLLYASFDEE